MKAIGAHIYAGGFTLGIKEHFDVVAHYENGKFGTETVKNNLGIPIHQKADGWPMMKDIELIYCNPPCAPWSASSVGRANTWDKDPRLSCQHECFGLLVQMRPRIWMLESVRGLYRRGLPMVMEFVTQARELGYCAYFVLCDAKEHGVPQTRRRFFLVLSQCEISWEACKSLEVTSGQALAAMTSPGDTRKTEMRSGIKWQTIVDKVKPGETMKNVFAAEFPELVGVPKCGRGSFMLRRLDPEGPAQTFTGDVKTFHPTEDRFLTIQEAAILSGFPEDYRFAGATGLGYNQIARGVLPPVAEYMGHMAWKAIMRAWHPQTLDPREVIVNRDNIEIHNV